MALKTRGGHVLKCFSTRTLGHHSPQASDYQAGFGKTGRIIIIFLTSINTN